MPIFDVIEDHLGLKSFLDHTQTYKWPFYAIQNVKKNVQILLSSNFFFFSVKFILSDLHITYKVKEHMHISKEGENSFVLKIRKESGNVEISHCHFIA
jgi:hypothetical protein